jgi:RHS repeat-associated protein
MGTSSANPDDLDQFGTSSQALINGIDSKLGSLRAAYSNFIGQNRWGGFDASALIEGANKFNGENRHEVDRVKTIARAFREAGDQGGIVSLPDAAITAALAAAHLAGTRQSITVDLPTAYGEPPTTGYANDPVNTASGNFVHTEVDLAFGGLVAELSFSRVYNSRSRFEGAFGLGWSSWADVRLRATVDGAAYVGPDGQQVTFPLDGQGYGRADSVRGLVEVDDNGLTLAWFGGTRWQFDAAGQLLQRESGPGAAVFAKYEGGRLVEMAHRNGRRITLEWAGDRVVALSSSDGRRVEYRYDESGRLVSVGGTEASYSYELSPEGRVRVVTDADGVCLVRNTYDAEGRVTAQGSSFGRTTQFAYLQGGVTATFDETGEAGNTWIHDPAGRLVGVVDAHEQRQSTSYDRFGNAVLMTTRGGATTVASYDERCRRTRSVLPTGVAFTFEYDTADRVVEVTSSTGAGVSYRYDGDERIPAEVTDAAGGITRIRVVDGCVRELIDPDGVRILIDVDVDGELVAMTDASGATARLERDAAGQVVGAVTPLGRRTEFTYGSHGLLDSKRSPSGAVWRYEYSAAGRLTAVVDPAGGRQETAYGRHGAPERFTDALGRAVDRSYDMYGHLVGVVGPDGAKWELAYDALSRLTRINDPSGGVWLREYDVDGNLVAAVDPMATRRTAAFDSVGLVTGVDDGLTSVAFAADGLGRTIMHSRPDGSELRAEYDMAGRVSSTTDPDGNTTLFEYSTAGRLVRRVSAMGRVERFEYDECGRLAARIDPAGQRWVMSYDADSALLEQRSPSGARMVRRFDAAGRLARQTSPATGPIEYEYDSCDRISAVTDRTFGRRRFDYDASGRLSAVTDARGGRTEYRSDLAGRITEVIDPLGAVTSYSYDELGRLLSTIDPLGRRTTIRYDAAGRPTERVDATGNVIVCSYGASGRVSALGPAGAQAVIGRDQLGRVSTIDEPAFNHRLDWTRSGRLQQRSRGELNLAWRYDADGLCSSLTLPDGSERLYERDDCGRISAVRDSSSEALTVARDADGRITSARSGDRSATWSYADGNLVASSFDERGHADVRRMLRDALGRLTGVERSGGSEHYDYDEAGQLIGLHRGGLSTAYVYDAAGRLTSETDGSSQIFYEYDVAAQLTSTRSAAGTVRYFYDAAGRRVAEDAGIRRRTFEWDSAGRMSGIDDPLTGRVNVSVDALGELARVNDLDVMWDSSNPLGPPVWLGSPIPHASAMLSGAPGSATDGRDVWGAPASVTPQLGDSGEVEFAELRWLRARVYDPRTRAMLAPDPLPPIAGAGWAGNPYAYAGNDPIGLADPAGLRPVTDAELKAYRDAMGGGIVGDTGHWIAEHKDEIIAGALIAGGVLVMATGFGGPIGAAMISGGLIAAGTSAAVQKITKGNVNWGQVAVNGMIGVAAGGVGAFAGAAAGGLDIASPLARAAVVNGTEGAASNLTAGAISRGVYGQNPLDPGGIATDLLVGGGAGAVGGSLGSLRRGVSEVDIPTVGSGSRSESTLGGGTTTVYRTEGVGNARLEISPDGSVSIKGENMLFLNFGSEDRAAELYSRQIVRYGDSSIKTFEVPSSYVDELRRSAVPEFMAKSSPGSPLVVDVHRAPDQFGLRAIHFQDLLDNIIPGSGGVR